MKKFFILLIAAVAATLTLCSASAALNGNDINGTVRFESDAIPALNFSMPVSRAADIFRLVPDSVAGVCVREYEAVRAKCDRASRFTHEGVSVRRTGDDASMTFEFAVAGYRLTVSDVSWADLDYLFLGTNGSE